MKQESMDHLDGPRNKVGRDIAGTLMAVGDFVGYEFDNGEWFPTLQTQDEAIALKWREVRINARVAFVLMLMTDTIPVVRDAWRVTRPAE